MNLAQFSAFYLSETGNDAQKDVGYGELLMLNKKWKEEAGFK